MATNGALADFARMPTERKALVFIVIGMVFGLLYYQFVFKSLNSSLDEAEQENDQKIKKSAQLDKDIPRFAEERLKYKQIQERISTNQKALPTEAELPAFWDTINRKITESGVTLAGWTQKPEVAVESFVKVPVDIELTGSFMQLKRFFASLVQKDVTHSANGEPEVVDDRDRIISIENLSLDAPTVKNGVIVLDAKFTASTFRQDEAVGSGSGSGSGSDQGSGSDAAAPPLPTAAGSGAPPSPTPPPAGSSAAPASGSAPAATPAAGGNPPLPSAATPAGAKARVEQSLEQGTERNEKALQDPGAGSQRLKGGI